MCNLLASIGFALPIAVPIILYLELVVFKTNKVEYNCPYNEWYCINNGGCNIHKSRKHDRD